VDGANDSFGAAKRMGSTGLGKTAEQGRVRCVEKDDGGGEYLADAFEHGRKAVEALALADIDDEGSTGDLSGLADQVGKIGNELEWHVVH
jgi:hypothetical protein